MSHCNIISTSYLKVGYESMSAIRFWKTAKGGLPRLPYIFCKPKPLVADFNTVIYSVTGALFSIDIHRLKQGMKKSKFRLQLVATVACTKIIVEATDWVC